MKQNGILLTAFPHQRPYLRHIKVCALTLLAALTTSAYADSDIPVPPRSERASEIRLTDKITTLPIVMVREFPFIEGTVAGVEGKFMLDTGAQDSLSINDNRVPVLDARTIGSGFFGSGQTFKIRLVPELQDIRIGGLIYPRATAVESMDARLLEGITPDFIGWIGYNAFSGHAMKLDYQNLRATFYRHGEADYLESERVVAELPFETRKLPNHPIQAGRIGEMDVVTSWDTGQHGNLYTSEEGKARLLREGRLTPSPTKPDSFDLHGLRLNGHTMPSIPSIAVHTTHSPAAAPIGISEADWLVLGYALLHQFKTVWDYDRQRIYLLER
ncbi:hypothetical protein [Lysobacter sp. D1-1-M9]|uniref:hypothetical protein n=1 Tax=Novilysobacter longmucuonensis TaxID=3098603 RepID=UPI00320345C6